MEKDLKDLSNLTEVEILERIKQKGSRKKTKTIDIKDFGIITVRELTSSEFKKTQQKYTTKKGTTTINLDCFYDICEIAIISPNFRSANLINGIDGAFSSRDVLEKTFSVGEIVNIANEILVLSGFDKDLNQEIEEIKK